jgi:hypothetical protein
MRNETSGGNSRNTTNGPSRNNNHNTHCYSILTNVKQSLPIASQLSPLFHRVHIIEPTSLSSGIWCDLIIGISEQIPNSALKAGHKVAKHQPDTKILCESPYIVKCLGICTVGRRRVLRILGGVKN